MHECPNQRSADFVGLLTKHQADISAYLISLMPGDPDVADVLQKTNLVLWSKRDKYQIGTNFIAWSFVIARFEALAHMRNRKWNRQVLLDQDLLETIAMEAAERFEHADQRLATLESCFGNLRQQDRDLLNYRYQSGSDLESYARRTGRSVSSLSVTLHRLRAALRRCVQGKLSLEGGFA